MGAGEKMRYNRNQKHLTDYTELRALVISADIHNSIRPLKFGAKKEDNHIVKEYDGG